MFKTLTAASLLALSLLAGCRATTADCAPAAPTEPAPLAVVLQERGYVAIPFERMATGHLLLSAQFSDGVSRRFLCDTGSSVTVVFPSLAEELGLDQEGSNDTAGGLSGGGLSIHYAQADDFSLNGVVIGQVELAVIDLSHINQQFTMAGESPIDGIIGGDWLSKHNALIDMESGQLFVQLTP